MAIWRGTSLGTLSLVGLPTGCDALFPGDPPSPYFHATLQGVVEAEYEGNGEFFWGSRSEELTIFSIDSWSLAAPVCERLQLVTANANSLKIHHGRLGRASIMRLI